ncbi:calcium-binding protein, partial [Ferrovibrio sp.]|uniref:calcium-binding protein n=1 Tax=Ferrovibrio sp. TaxID=1917215 RepID=UPI0035AF6510
TTDVVTIDDWYVGATHQIEQFRTNDGKVLSNDNVDNLVNAMATFSAPAAGQTTLPAAYQGDLLPVIAANWH